VLGLKGLDVEVLAIVQVLHGLHGFDQVVWLLDVILLGLEVMILGLLGLLEAWEELVGFRAAQVSISRALSIALRFGLGSLGCAVLLRGPRL